MKFHLREVCYDFKIYVWFIFNFQFYNELLILIFVLFLIYFLYMISFIKRYEQIDFIILD
jgi:hypothetical protein